MVVGIIGGGASGMAAALAASENPNVMVVLMERQARVGRKLLATGNGRCNLSNLHASASSYHGQNPAFTEYALVIKWIEKTSIKLRLRRRIGYCLPSCGIKFKAVFGRIFRRTPVFSPPGSSSLHSISLEMRQGFPSSAVILTRNGKCLCICRTTWMKTS